MKCCTYSQQRRTVRQAHEAASRAVTDITRAAGIISRIGVLLKKGAQRELVDINELIQEMIVLLRSEVALPLHTAAP